MNYYDQLLNFLDAHRFLVLPGVGTIVISRTYSDFTQNGSAISAPRFHLELLKEDSTSFHNQVSRLAEVWSLSENHVQGIFEVFSSELYTELSEVNRTQLPGIGSLMRMGNSIHLQSSGDIERKLHYLKSDVVIHQPFRLRAREEKQAVEREVKEPRVPLYQAMTRSMRWAAASLLLFVVLLVGVGVSPEVKSFLQPVRFSFDNTNYSQDDFNRAPETDGSERNIDVLLSEGQFEPDLATESELSKEEGVSTPPIKRILIFSSEGYESISPSEECTYIAGSFKSSRRALKMKRILTEEGFTIYESPYKDFTRIGIIVPCDQDSSLARLSKIESGYWLLQD